MTVTTLDGVGRPVLVQKNGGVTATVYAPCACSPLGKIQKVSAPYPAGQSAVGWTTYTYDGIGRTLTSTLPDGASTTTYSYSGNLTTVTDPAGKWKTFATDVLGNPISVTEPDPANQPGGVLTTTYTYDWANRLTGVSMPRGTTTQTRSFSYSDGGNLLSATNPENGTVTYTYNSDNTLNTKTDAKGQTTTYTYDSSKRVTGIQRDACSSVTYAYGTDANSYSMGRLTTASYSLCVPNQNTGASTVAAGEFYSYHPAGAVTGKSLTLTCFNLDDNGNCVAASYGATYSYNSAGQVSSYGTTGGPTYSYTYDSMARPVSLVDNAGDLNGSGVDTVWAQNVSYDYAGRMTSMQFYNAQPVNVYAPSETQYTTKTQTWNVNGQLTGLSYVTTAGFNGNYVPPENYGILYNYSSNQNNGQITSKTDTGAGVTVTYQYDQLKRLLSASSTPSSGTTPAAWTETFGYDGFGNLTSKVLNGTTTAIPVNAATNRLTNAFYDGNGNMTSGAGATMTYDGANRMTSATEVSGGTEYYGYAPDNKRILRVNPAGQMFITLYGALGEKLAVYGPSTYCCVNGAIGYYSAVGSYVWFGSQLVWQGSGPVSTDRLGSVVGQMYPYGESVGVGGAPSTVGYDSLLFATYTRDSFTGMDYADQRMYASVYGRFLTPDRSRKSVNPGIPGSWNRYSYVLGDPVNKNDPSGRYACDADDGDDYSCGDDSFDGNGAGNDGSGGGGACSSVVASEDCGLTTIASSTVCATPGQQFINGMCDVPVYQSSLITGIFTQVGSNLQGADTLIGMGAASAATFALGAAVTSATATAATSIFGDVPASAFAGGSPSLQVAVDDIAVTRVTPTATNVAGAWTTTETITSGSQATSILALPPSGGVVTSTTAGFATSGVIPAGTAYFTGIAAPLFGQIGGGIQIWGAPVLWGATTALPWLPHP